jgi:hypothetical protein
MSKLYRHQFIWLSVPGGVQGILPEEINPIIEEYNRNIYRYGDFWDYFQYKTGIYASGFSFWNNGNPLFSKVKTIRKSELENLINEVI